MTKVALFDAHGGSISSHVWLYRKILPNCHQNAVNDQLRIDLPPYPGCGL
jgi:hypothetical protein